jgi:YD repeat-containing protein
MGHKVSFTYDAVGRPKTQTNPDGGVIQLTYDEAGNPTSLAPPGRPAHTFSYTPRELVSRYLAPPPPPNGQTSETDYSYDRDDARTGITRADGQTVQTTYDEFGRFAQFSFLRGQVNATYDSAGRLSGLAASGGLTLTFGYDGSLLTSESADGPVMGAITSSFDNNQRVTLQSVNGTALSLQYDADGLPTQVGELTVARDAQTDSPPVLHWEVLLVPGPTIR